MVIRGRPQVTHHENTMFGEDHVFSYKLTTAGEQMAEHNLLIYQHLLKEEPLDKKITL